MLTGMGKRVAVLAVDPSSARSGGSILGDKTRMEHLVAQPDGLLIRPSPSQAQMGVARRTREAVALCEAAGFDVILIETVGVGQSETMVAEMCTEFLLLRWAPAAVMNCKALGRGTTEMADLILVNKSDGDLKPAALRTMADYAGGCAAPFAQTPARPSGFSQGADTVSAIEQAGLAEREQMQTLADWRRAHGHWTTRRAEQSRHWFEAEVRHGLRWPPCCANRPRASWQILATAWPREPPRQRPQRRRCCRFWANRPERPRTPCHRFAAREPVTTTTVSLSCQTNATSPAGCPCLNGRGAR